MNILIAPNAFKNSLDAQAVARAISEGFMQSDLDCNRRLFPVADGGDGTGDLIIKHCNGEVITTTVHDALGKEIRATFGLIDDGKTAVIEMANAAGLRLLNHKELNPMLANSAGTGQMIKNALDKGVNKIIIGMGGSATVDGSVGILSTLGVRFLDTGGHLLKPVPGDLERLATIDTFAIDKRVFDCEITILCDVDNKLLGERGAAAVFGPQKGAVAADVIMLDKFLSNFSAVTLRQTGIDIASIKHSGTAGGAAAGLHAFINAKLVSGAISFLQLTGFNEALKTADLVITGEGSIDEQTLQGKAPAAVARLAKQHGLKVIGLAGNIPTEKNEAFNAYFDELVNINPGPTDQATAFANTYKNLVNTTRQTGNRLALALK